MTKVSGIERSRIFLWPILYGGACPIPPYAGRLLSEMINEIYNKRILELAADIPRQGRLAHPDASATVHSKLCGSTVTVDLRVEKIGRAHV